MELECSPNVLKLCWSRSGIMYVAIAWDHKLLLLLALHCSRIAPLSLSKCDKQRIQMELRSGNTVLIYFRSGVGHHQSVLIALAADLHFNKPWQGQHKFWKYVSPRSYLQKQITVSDRTKLLTAFLLKTISATNEKWLLSNDLVPVGRKYVQWGVRPLAVLLIVSNQSAHFVLKVIRHLQWYKMLSNCMGYDIFFREGPSVGGSGQRLIAQPEGLHQSEFCQLQTHH